MPIAHKPLFNPSIPILPKSYSNADLQNLHAAFACNIHYLNICIRPDWLPIKDFFEDAWRDFETIADANFIQQFSTSAFYAKAWELLLFKALADEGFKAVSNGGVGPDLKIPLGNSTLWIEAVNSGKGKKENAVITLTELMAASPNNFVIRDGHIDDHNNPKSRRLASSLKEKIEKYNAKYKSLIGPNDYFLIAISGAEIEGEMRDKELLLQLVAGINPAQHLPLLPNGSFGPAYYNKRTVIPNALGTDSIPQDWFNDPQANKLSGVIFSGQSPIDAILQNSYYVRTLLAHNPNSTSDKKIPIELMNFFTQLRQVPEGWGTIQSKYFEESKR